MRDRVSNEALVAPYDAARVVNGAYELSLGPEVYVTSAETETKRVIVKGEQVPIPPGQFANLLTEEVVTVPADALGLISVKFRLKQRGLVNVSGFHVDPGYSARLLFSVYNAGPRTVVVARGEAAFLLWYASFDKPTAEDDLYKGQKRDRITSEDVMHLQGEIATPQALAERVGEVERRLNRWRARFETAGKAVLGALVGAAIGWLLAFAAGFFDSDAPRTKDAPSVVTTTSTPTSTTSANTPTTVP